MTEDEARFWREAQAWQERANRAPLATDKEAWLRIAQGWLSMIRTLRDEERFDDQVQRQGTHQDVSKEPQ